MNNVYRLVESFYKICKQLDDLLPGGKGDNLSKDDVSDEALRKGMAVEEEHVTSDAVKKLLERHDVEDPEEIANTLSTQIQSEIARDHLAESDEYYDALEKMEAELEK